MVRSKIHEVGNRNAGELVVKYDLYISLSEHESKKELASFGAILDTEKPNMNTNILQLAFMLVESYICGGEEWQWVRVQKG